MRGLVIGAGIGGLLTARLLAEKGLKVSLFEMNEDVFSHFTGELTGKPARDILGTDPVDNRFGNCRVVSLDTGKEINIPADLYLLSADRLKLSMLENVFSAGVKVHFNSRVSGLRIGASSSPPRRGEKGSSPGSRVSVIISNEKFHGDFAAGCDGIHSIVAGEFFPDKDYRTLKAIRYKIKGRHPFDIDTAYFFIGEELGLGYLWCYPRSERDLNIGVGSIDKTNLMEILAGFMRRYEGLDGRKIISRGGGSIPYSGLRRNFARRDMALVGNAAGQVSSLLGGGIEATIHGADCLAEAFDGNLEFDPEQYVNTFTSSYPRVQRSARMVSPIMKIRRSGRLFYHMEKLLDLVSEEDIIEVVGEGRLYPSARKMMLRHPLFSLGLFRSYLMGRKIMDGTQEGHERSILTR